MAGTAGPHALFLAAAFAVLAHSVVSGTVEDLGDGLTLEVLQEGDGLTFPVAGDKLSMDYTGTYNGTKFDSSRDRHQAFVFTIGVGQVISGWDRGVLKMSLGERAVLHVPAKLAYGAAGAGEVIPPNADLDFDVQLLKIGNKEAVLPAAGDDAITDGGSANSAGIAVTEVAAKGTSSSTGIVLVAVASSVFGCWHAFRWLTSPGDTPPPLLSEAELAEDDGFMGGGSSWQGRQLVSGHPPQGFSSF